jgi:hypothetical protein
MPAMSTMRLDRRLIVLVLAAAAVAVPACATPPRPADTATGQTQAAGGAVQGAPTPPTSAEEREVIEVVQRFFDGMRTRDTALMRSVVDSNARLVGTATRNGTPFVTPPIPMRDFITQVGRATGDEWNERIYDAEARVADNLAMVWTKYTFHTGAKFSHCGVDAIQLARYATGWKIIHVADTRRTEGCPTQPMG